MSILLYYNVILLECKETEQYLHNTLPSKQSTNVGFQTDELEGTITSMASLVAYTGDVANCVGEK